MNCDPTKTSIVMLHDYFIGHLNGRLAPEPMLENPTTAHRPATVTAASHRGAEQRTHGHDQHRGDLGCGARDQEGARVPRAEHGGAPGNRDGGAGPGVCRGGF